MRSECAHAVHQHVGVQSLLLVFPPLVFLTKAGTETHTELRKMKGPHQPEWDIYSGNMSIIYPCSGIKLHSEKVQAICHPYTG